MFNETAFAEFVKGLTEEKKASPYNLTIEFSTSAEFLPEKLKILAQFNTEKYVWKVCYCTTCAEDDPDYPFHVELIEWS